MSGDCLKELKLSASFNHEIDDYKQLETLEILNSPLQSVYISQSIKRLVLNYKYISFIPVVNNIEYLEYDIPPYISKIIINNSDKQIVLNHQSIPKEFNPITGNFDVETQVSIDEIILSGFNSPTKLESQGHLFKSNIKKLSFKHFKSIIPKDYLPSSLQELELLDDKTLLESNSIPLVKTLKLNSKDDIDNNDNSFDFKSIIPKSVEILHIGGKLEPSEIPSNVKEIHINIDSNYDHLLKPNISTIEEKQYPPYNKTDNLFLYLWRINRLKVQIFNYNHRSIFTPPEYTPQQLLQRLTFVFRGYDKQTEKYFKEKMALGLIDGIQHKVEYFSARELEGIKYIKTPNGYIVDPLPLSVTHLTLINYYHPIVEPQKAQELSTVYFPDSVTYLNIINTTKRIPSNIPSSIKHLVIYTSDFKKEEIPSSVQTLEVRDVSIFSIKPHKVPSTVQRLLFNRESYQNLKSNDSIHPEILSKCSEGQVIEIYKQGNPISTKTTTLIWCDNKIIDKDIIPNNVKRIIFGHQFNQLLVEGTIPSTITEINFGNSFNQNLKKTYLPPSLTYLSFGKNFNQPFDKDTLPPNLCYLTLKQLNPKQSLSHLPPSVSYLFLENIKEISKLDLPFSVKNLKVYSNSGQTLQLLANLESLHTNLELDFIRVEKKVEPNVDISLMSLSADTYASNIKIHLYSQIFDKFIKPNSLISNIYSIDFGNSFRQPILPTSLPNSLKKLNFGDSFNRQMGKDCIPSSVEIICFGDYFNQPLNPGVLPSSVTDLDLGKSFNQDLELDSLPYGLKKLRIPFFENFEKIVTCIPSTVEELTIANGYQNTNRLSCHLIPLSIKTLNFEPDLCVRNMNRLPPNVQKLSLCDQFEGLIPLSVESIQLSSSFNQPLKSIFSSTQTFPQQRDFSRSPPSYII
ncbi:hypothetical protein CYY_007472 [Polysphondylium violaceum]|uniref:FNIP repeat-containing protein n=1 Tax=Polysphondylium violaceum TaxID=133409 RepID=A0A8J4V4V8_9MYCE|nr:hypothetical protein CYY_007472 [Polysphondylium violaceum]